MEEEVSSPGRARRLSPSEVDGWAPALSLARWVLEKCVQVAFVLFIVWIALIGIFAIEQIKARGEVLRVIVARKAEIVTRLENVRRSEHVGAAAAGARPLEAPNTETRSLDVERTALEDEQATLNSLTDRITTLALTGAMTTSGSLPHIVCDLLTARKAVAQPAATHVACLPDESYRSLARIITLQHLTDRSANGALLAVLIITAAIGGAVIRLSLAWEDRKPKALQSLLRAIGGGIVCYLVLDGGQFPLSPFDVTKYTSPATASLLGLLSGMFSDRLFTLLSQLVDALVERMTPGKKRDETPGKDTPKPGHDSEAAAAAHMASATIPLAEPHVETSARAANPGRDETLVPWDHAQPSKALAVKTG